jgi:voltage-gated potassium channel
VKDARGQASAASWSSPAWRWYCSIILKAALWAAVYLGLGVLADWDTGIYFSIVTMTTVGYGDVILSGDWRLLAAFQAMTGMFVFGLNAAFLFAILQHYWSPVRRSG